MYNLPDGEGYVSIDHGEIEMYAKGNGSSYSHPHAVIPNDRNSPMIMNMDI